MCVLDTLKLVWPVEEQALKTASSVYREGSSVNYAIRGYIYIYFLMKTWLN